MDSTTEEITEVSTTAEKEERKVDTTVEVASKLAKFSAPLSVTHHHTAKDQTAAIHHHHHPSAIRHRTASLTTVAIHHHHHKNLFAKPFAKSSLPVARREARRVDSTTVTTTDRDTMTDTDITTVAREERREDTTAEPKYARPSALSHQHQVFQVLSHHRSLLHHQYDRFHHSLLSHQRHTHQVLTRDTIRDITQDTQEVTRDTQEATRATRKSLSLTSDRSISFWETSIRNDQFRYSTSISHPCL